MTGLYRRRWSHVVSSDPGLGLIGTLINTPVIQTTTGSAFIGGIEGGGYAIDGYIFP
jgi:hypothetical protein